MLQSAHSSRMSKPRKVRSKYAYAGIGRQEITCPNLAGFSWNSTEELRFMHVVYFHHLATIERSVETAKQEQSSSVIAVILL